jgi:hypothetical protein
LVSSLAHLPLEHEEAHVTAEVGVAAGQGDSKAQLLLPKLLLVIATAEPLTSILLHPCLEFAAAARA